MSGLSQQDLDIRRRAREFVDDLVQYEVETELAGGVLPAGLSREAAPRGAGERAVRHQHAHVGRRSRASRPCSRCSCRSRSAGSPTASPGACTRRRSGGSRWPPTSSASGGCCRRSAASGTSATRSPRSTPGRDVSELAATARLDGDEYVVNGVKWHVTSYNVADYCFVQAVLTDGEHAGEHVLLVVDLPSPGIEVVRTPAYSHHIADEHPIVSLHRRAHPGLAADRPRGRGDDVHPGLVPLRAGDGRGPLRRRVRLGSWTR